MGVEVTVLSADGEMPGGAITKRFEKNEIFIGRMDTSDLVIDSPTVSDTHLKLFTEESGGELKVFVMDCDSTNGTAVERTPLIPGVPTELPPKKRVLFANHLLKVSLVGDEMPGFLEEGVHSASEAVSALGAPLADEVELDKAPKGPPSGGVKLGDTLVMEEKQKADSSLPGGIQLSESLEVNIERPKSVSSNGFDLTSVAAKESAPEPTPKKRAKARRVKGRANRKEAPRTKVSPLVEVGEGEVKMVKPEGSPGIAQLPAESQINGKRGSSFFATVFLGSKREADISIVASQVFKLCGVVACEGAGVEGVEIDAGELGKFRTDKDGRFEILEVIEGTKYALQISKEGYQLESGTLEGVLNEDVDLAIEMLMLGTISGYVIHDDKPLANVRVFSEELGETETDKDGKFEFCGVPTNKEYQLRIEKSGYKFSDGSGESNEKQVSNS